MDNLRHKLVVGSLILLAATLYAAVKERDLALARKGQRQGGAA